MFGSLMFVSKILMEGLPNFHLIAAMTVALTVVYRTKALIPLYVFVFLTGYFNGFSVWWGAYLYIWAILWGITMLLPKNIPPRVAPFVYCAVCAFHGFAFGALYAPYQMLMFHLSFKGMLAWIAAGFFPWDCIHGVGNIVAGTLVVPMILLLKKLRAVYEK